jgi:hypothetical protein
MLVNAMAISLKTPVSAAASAMIELVLRSNLEEYGLEKVVVEPGVDHDGDPVIFVDAYYKLSNEPVQPAITLQTLSRLRAELITLGEDRFPHLRHHFSEAQKVAGFH